MTTITYYVHATTVHNEQKIASGWSNVGLSALGVKQAHELYETVKNRSYDAIFCSDLKRARQTANIAFKNRSIIFDAKLREVNDGDFTQKPVALYDQNREFYINHPFPHGESYQDVQARMKQLLLDINQRYFDKNIALLAHQAPQLAMEVLLKGKSWPQAIKEDWRNTMAYQPGWKYQLPKNFN